MEIIQYVKWTTPKEEQEFLNLAKQYQNDTEFIEHATKIFNTDKLSIRICMLRFKDKITKVRNKLSFKQLNIIKMKNNELCAGVYVAQGPELNVLINLTGKAPMLSIISAIDLNAFFKEGMVRALNPSNIEIQDILMYPEKYQFETLNTSSTVNNLSGYDDGVNRDESSITEEFIEECTRKFKDIIKITNDFNMSKIKMKIWLKREHQMSISQGEAFIGKLMERMKPNL